MKPMTFLLFLFLLAPSLFSQTYESIFGENSTQWNMTAGNLWGFTTNEHRIVQDTLIDGMSYKMVGEYSLFDYFGFLREDQSTGRVWYRSNQSDEEMLIMDLSLNVNDSFYVGGIWNSNHDYHRVDSIYYKEGRKHIRLDLELIHTPRAEKLIMIEGITTNMGFRYKDCYYPNNVFSDLLCVFKDGEQVYGTNECLVSEVEEVHREPNLKVYPNPFRNQITIDSKENGGWGSYLLVDQYGRVIQTAGIHHPVQKINKLGHLPNGIYFIVIQSKDYQSSWTNPLMKVD